MTNRQEKRRAEREANKITKTLPFRYEKHSRKGNLTGAETKRMQRVIQQAFMPVALSNLLEDVPYDQ